MKKKLLSVLVAAILIVTVISPVSMISQAALPTCYQQRDSQWANIMYGSKSLGESGCGILSTVNAVNYLTGNFIHPTELAQWGYNNNHYNGTGGTGTMRWGFYGNVTAAFGAKYGFSISGCQGGNVSSPALINHLKNGGAAIVHVYNHFMALTAYNASTGQYLVYDSAAGAHRGTTVSNCWLTAAQLNSNSLSIIDWFCLVSATGSSTVTPAPTPTLYTLKAYVDGGQGVVHFGEGATSAQVAANTLVHFQTTPAVGYKVSKIVVGGTECSVINNGADTVYTFNMPSGNCDVRVTFEKVAEAVKVSKYYKNELIASGFPDSYIPMLAALHEKHPNWNFIPMNVTELDSKFTWDYVIGQMMSYPARNLVVKSTWAPSPFTSLGDANYLPYRDNEGATYDSGSWYAATESAVKYFMDPRNFLNDTDCFMFLDWKYNDTGLTSSQVETVLGSSYFANKVIPNLDGKTTYAGYLLEAGTELGVDPLFLSARLVQENGTGTSPMVQGTTGDYLGKPEYNGLYNLYNINAGGTGLEQIYTNGMAEAVAGTAVMADRWGGSPSWDTHWKAIYGGIYSIREKYVRNYKSTLYLQKFNVDPRGTNTFSGYMQNIAAPLTEGRNFRKALYTGGILDNAYNFYIPVYSGMPSLPSSDPGNGTLYYSYTEVPKTEYTATGGTYVNAVDSSAAEASPVTDNVVKGAITVNEGSAEDIVLNGWSVNTEGTKSFYYTVDDGEERHTLNKQQRLDVFQNGYMDYANYCDSTNIGYNGSFNPSTLTPGKHYIKIYALNNKDESYLSAYITVNVNEGLGWYSCLDSLTTTATAKRKALEGEVTVKQGALNSVPIRGWAVSGAGIKGFEYSVDSGERVALTAQTRQDVINAYGDFAGVCDAATTGFNGGLDTYKLSLGRHKLRVYAKTAAGESFVIADITVKVVDGIGPNIKNVQICDRTDTSYVIKFEVSDDNGVDKVKLPTWTGNNNQADIIWFEPTVYDGVVYQKINLSDFGSAVDTYITHIYAYDTAGNESVYHVNVDRDEHICVAGGYKLNDDKSLVKRCKHCGKYMGSKSGSYTIGDIDIDGDMDAYDLITLRQVLMGEITADEVVRTLCDVNYDENVDLVDLLRVKRILASQ